MKTVRTRRQLRLTLYALASIQIMLMGVIALCLVAVKKANKIPPSNIFLNPVSKVVFDGYPNIPADVQEFSVRVRVQGGMGSGVAISERRVLTSHHVVQTALVAMNDSVWCDTTKGSFVFKVVATDQPRDLAIIEGPANFKFEKWAKLRADPMKWGQSIIAVGCTNGNLPMPTTGYFVRDMPNGLSQLSIVSYWGGSGGGLFEARTGELIGIMFSVDSPSDHGGTMTFPPHIFFCVPAKWIGEFLADHPEARPVP